MLIFHFSFSSAMLPAASPITPRLNLSLNSSGAQQTFASVQLRGVRMLAAILGIQVPPKDGSGESRESLLEEKTTWKMLSSGPLRDMDGKSHPQILHELVFFVEK